MNSSVPLIRSPRSETRSYFALMQSMRLRSRRRLGSGRGAFRMRETRRTVRGDRKSSNRRLQHPCGPHHHLAGRGPSRAQVRNRKCDIIQRFIIHRLDPALHRRARAEDSAVMGAGVVADVKITYVPLLPPFNPIFRLSVHRSVSISPSLCSVLCLPPLVEVVWPSPLVANVFIS